MSEITIEWFPDELTAEEEKIPVDSVWVCVALWEGHTVAARFAITGLTRGKRRKIERELLLESRANHDDCVRAVETVKNLLKRGGNRWRK